MLAEMIYGVALSVTIRLETSGIVKCLLKLRGMFCFAF